MDHPCIPVFILPVSTVAQKFKKNKEFEMIDTKNSSTP